MSTESAFASEFSQSEFEEAIRETMKMGMPQEAAQQLRWYWKRERSYAPDDVAGNPYDWNAAPTANEPGNDDLADVDTEADQWIVVVYALEFSARPAGSIVTTLGEIDTSRAVVTMFDDEYQKIRTADYARIGDALYRIQIDAPPTGMFGSTVWTVILEATDEA